MVDGFSSADPRLARGRQESAGQAAARRKLSRGSRRRRRPSPQPTVKINGGTVTIDGQGFSVAPSLQAEFIRKKTGGSGSSAQAAIVRAQQLAVEEAKRLELQKAQEAAKAKLLDAQAKAEMNRISALQTRILRDRGRITEKKSRDVRTGNILNITEIKKNGNIVKRVYDTKTGEIKFTTYGVGRAGGGIRRTGGVTLGAAPKPPKTAADIASKVKITQSSDPNKVIVTFPNGQRGTINAKGKVVVGARLAGKKYLFEDGVIIAVDGKSTFARAEYVSQPEAQLVEKPTERVDKIINKLNNLRGKASTSSIRNQQNELMNELSLLGLSTATTVINGAVGLVALGGSIGKLIKNPSEIKKLPGVLKQIPGAISKGGQSFGRLIVVSPTEAIGVIAGEYILFKGSGLTFKAAGKVSSKVVKLVKPALRKADKIAWRITGKTIKIAKKSKTVRRVVSKVKKVKAIQKKEIAKFKSAVEYSNELKRARAIRKLASKRGRTLSFGDRDFIESVAFVEDTADKLAIMNAKRILKQFKARGGKLGVGKKEEFIRAVRRYVKNTLNENPTFKRLKDYSKLTEPYQVKLIKTNKLLSARNLAKKINIKIKKLPLTKKATSILKRASKTVKKIRKAPRRIKKALAVRKLKRVARKQFRKTNRYRMQKARGIRKVTTQQLERSLTVNQYKKFVDDVFDEIASRQGVKIGDLKYRQFKNVIKKRLAKAIKAGDKSGVDNFKANVKKIIRDMNKPGKAPTVKVVKKGTKSYKTIKDFKPETPKGKYVEVKRGQQVLLQEVKQVQKVKTVQKLVQKPKVFVIMSVQKQSINLLPLLQFGVASISALAFKTLQKQQQKMKSGQVLSTKQVTKVLQDSAQDLKVLQSVAQASGLKFDVAQRTSQDIASKLRLRQRLRTVQKLKEKKIITRRTLPDKFKKKTISKKVPVFYIKVKRRGRIVNLLPKPLTIRDAKDYLSYKLDKGIVRTGYFEPIGKAKNVVRLPSNIKGYFKKVKHKMRPYKVRAGKKKLLRNGFIEKRRYALDQKRELAQLKQSKLKYKRKKAIKRTVRKPKKITRRKKARRTKRKR